MIHRLGNITKNTEIGGKARELDRLLKNGFNVPPGVVFDADSWTSDEWRDELAEAMKSLGSGLFAVRSSGAAEDSAASSMAGMFLSKTRVHRKDIISSIEELLVFAKKVEPDMPFAVIVQEWVEGDASGVAFSKHPTKSLGDVVVLDSVSGTLERLVSGEVTARRGFVWEDRALLPTGFPLTTSVAEKVAEQIRKIETLLDKPADVEWTVTGDTVHILQARPLTHLPSPSVLESDEGRVMHAFADETELRLERSDYAETLPRPSRASFDLLSWMYLEQGPFTTVAEELGMEVDLDAAHNYFHTVLGWLYVDARRTPFSIKKGFISALKSALNWQRELRDFPSIFYAMKPLVLEPNESIDQLLEHLDDQPGRHYARVALLTRIALAQKRLGGIDFDALWKQREAWLAARPSRVSVIGFELSASHETRERPTWHKPTTIADLYAIMREDAKDELRPIFAALSRIIHQDTSSSPSEWKRLQDESASIRMPQTLLWQDLFDVRQAYKREMTNAVPSGIGVSEGVVTGPALVTKTLNGTIPEGSILVMEALTPEWFERLTPRIAGLITETGSLMSHGAIQCRERKIPAVFGYAEATLRFKDGQTVTLDGKTGEVA